MNRKTRKILANNLLNLREELGMTQEQLAYEVGLSVRTYGKMERMDENVKLDTLEKVADTFGVEVSNLLSTEFNLHSAAEKVMERISIEQDFVSKWGE